MNEKGQFEQNKQHHADFEFAMGVNRILLYITASWPFRPRGQLISKIITKIVNGIQLLYLTFFIASLILHVTFNKSNLIMRIQNIGLINLTSICQLKYIVFLLSSKKIYKCIEFIRNDWKEATGENRKIMIKYARDSRQFSSYCATFMFIAWAMYQWPIVFKSPMIVNNTTTYQFVFNSYFIVFDASDPAYRLYVQLFHIWSGFLLIALMCNISSFIVSCMLHACGQYQIAIFHLEQLTEGLHTNTDEKLVEIIKRHCHATKFSSVLENTYTYIFQLEAMQSIFAMLFSGYTAIMDDSGILAFVAGLFAIGASGITIFLLCFFAEKIMEHSYKLRTAAYMTTWYAMSSKQIRHLNLLMYVCQYPPTLTAGKATVLNMETLCEVYKRAIGMMNVFKAMST